MNPSPALHVGAIVFERFELLDLLGPLEMFGLLGDHARTTLLAEKAGAISSSSGPRAVADAAMADAGGFDVLLIPGGIGTRKVMTDARFLAELTRLTEASQLIATVCTGSLLLSMTGLLDGRKATSNKRVFQEVTGHRPDVNWIASARWIEDDKYFTSSGISAGMDMTLAVIAKLRGRESALEVAQKAEYTWQEDSTLDPFASPPAL
jgi:putative intracellular protease/amidase